MSSQADFTRHVPGFDFLQGLMKSAGAGLPAVGQWIAPTLDPDELDKRIQELKTVQFWLEQNARLLATTIQALEVQRMTLATLRGMNMPMADLTESLKIRPSAAAPAAPAPAPAPAPAAAPAPTAKTAARASAKAKAAAEPAPGLVDPVQWWGALTQQFTDLAAQALKDSAKAAAAAPVAASAASPAAKRSPATPRSKARRR